MANIEQQDAVPDNLELVVYSHSQLVFWWPVWLVGYVMAFVSYFRGAAIPLDQVRNDVFHPSSWPGVLFTMVLLLVILFTSVKLRGIYSLTLIIALMFFTVLFAWLGWWDDILQLIPHVSVHMNLGFYLVFSTALLVMWLLMFFVFDRMTYWRFRPGQVIEEHLIGGGEKSFDAHGMLVEQRSQDLLRHVVLGLGAGDFILRTGGAHKAEILIPNVLMVERRVRAIQRLVAVQPEAPLPQEA
jgi:hypothetical protein